jgi:hypothetical protein
MLNAGPFAFTLSATRPVNIFANAIVKRITELTWFVKIILIYSTVLSSILGGGVFCVPGWLTSTHAGFIGDHRFVRSCSC